MTSGGRACPERSEGAVDKAAVGPAAVIDRLRTQFYCRSPLLHLDPLTQPIRLSRTAIAPPANQTRLKSLLGTAWLRQASMAETQSVVHHPATDAPQDSRIAAADQVTWQFCLPTASVHNT
jgi:hypothetical protein